ncbi:MAG: U32 family peptidase, partial [Endomicrobium sp.]|nr:U32 family peptidase [Endomicrobium sp.]
MPQNIAKKPELLLPAGSLTKLKTAFLYGADAVYAGIPEMSLRAKSKFPLEEMDEGISFAHNLGKKAYLTLNLFSHNKDISKLEDFAKTIKIL